MPTVTAGTAGPTATGTPYGPWAAARTPARRSFPASTGRRGGNAGAGRNPDEVSREAVALPCGTQDLLAGKALNYGVRGAG
ncbi:hypothetical protein ACFVTC_37550 [Streptomyces sp. NPDC057950]|uniref:hypothetical protein n=1 Tax=Streptomyces sp. NPDC057950 TaxID=3346288 RepID=UPI0036E99266